MSEAISGAASKCATVCRGNYFRVIFSDVCNAAAIVLMVITLGASSTDPKDAFSWSKFKLNYYGDDVHVNFGLLKISWCDVGPTYSYLGCATTNIGDVTEGSPSQCSKAGQGVIAAATFAMLFGLLSIIWLHIFTSFKQWCKCRIPFPRAFIAFWSFMSLTLYIVVVATWYSQCHGQLQDSRWYFVSKSNSQNADSVTPGYAIALAVLVIVLSFLGWVFNFSRTCFPNKNEPIPAQAATSYAQQGSTSNLSAQGEGETYGGDSSTYGVNPAGSYSAPQSGGGYGGSAGGYGGSAGGYGGSYGGSSGGYGGSAGGYGGAYGGSGGGAYSNNQSAYG